MSLDLLYCMDMKHYSRLKEILVKTPGLDLNEIMTNDYSPLCYCIYKSVADKDYNRYIDLLLKLKSSVHARDGDNKTPLYYAVRYGLTITTKKLLARGAKPPDIQNGQDWAVLHFASVYAYDDIIQLIYNSDRECINQRNDVGETALHLASEHGNESTVQLLLNIGASPHIKNTFQGYTPLHKAAINGHTDTAVILIHKGASVHEADSSPLMKSPIQVAGDLGFYECAAVMSELHEKIANDAKLMAREKWLKNKQEEQRKRAAETARKRIEQREKKKEADEKRREEFRAKALARKHAAEKRKARRKFPKSRSKFDENDRKIAENRHNEEANRDAREFTVRESKSRRGK